MSILTDVFSPWELDVHYRLAEVEEEREKLAGLLGLTVHDEFGREWVEDVRPGGHPREEPRLSAVDTAGGAGPDDGAPPDVIRGAKSQEVGLDWLRFSGPAVTLSRVRQWLAFYFGSSEEGRGLWGYRHGYTFEGGVRLCFNIPEDGADRQKGHLGVEVPGSAINRWPADRRVEFLTDMLAQGLWCTRIDVAWDVVGDDVQLCQAVHSACESGQLVGARRYTPLVSRTAEGRVLGYTVYLGRRGGSGSGRMVRVYDKGLEEGMLLPNKWHRWECEFTGDCARRVGDLLGGGVEFSDWAVTARRLTLGAVDFREVTGSRELARRPRCGWWVQVLQWAGREVDPVRITARRQVSSYEKWRRHVRGAYGPTLVSMAREAGCSLSELCETLFSGVKGASAGTLRGPVLRDWGVLLDERASFAA